MAADLIEKEEIKNYTLIKAQEKAENLKEKMKQAERVGNAYKGKVFITFATTNGNKKVETTVWNASEGHIQLKAGTMIPIESIVDIVI